MRASIRSWVFAGGLATAVSALLPTAFAQGPQTGPTPAPPATASPPASTQPDAPTPTAPPVVAEPAPLASGAKCATHAECGGELLCIGHRCAVPSNAKPPPPPPQTESAPPSGAGQDPPVAPVPEAGPTFEGTRILLGAERLFGLAFWSNTRTVTGSGSSEETSVSGSSIALLWGTASPDSVPAMAFALPRLALDVRIGPYFLVGGSAAYFGGSSEQKSKGKTDENPSLYMYLFAPRVGVAVPLSSRLLVLGRAGVTIYGFEQTEKNSKGGTAVTATSGIALSLDASLAYMIVPHAALTLGVGFDRGLTGSVTQDPAPSKPPDVSMIPMNVGLTGGLMVAF